MKVLKTIIIAVFTLQSVSSRAGIVQDVKDTSILKQSGVTIGSWWQQVKPFVEEGERKKADLIVDKFSDYKVPNLVATPIQGDGIRVLLQDGSDSVVIDLFNDDKRTAVINGLVFSREELSSLTAIFEKLLSKTKKASMETKWLTVVSLIFDVFLPNSLAAASCQDSSGSICWDQMSNDEATLMKQVLVFISENSISNQAVAESARISNAELESCLKKNESEKCKVQASRKKVLERIVGPQAMSTSKSGGSNSEEKESFWHKHESWLKPLSIVAGIGVFVWGLCKTNTVRIFGCGKKSNGSQTASLPGSVPSNPIYTGTGTE